MFDDIHIFHILFSYLALNIFVVVQDADADPVNDTRCDADPECEPGSEHQPHAEHVEHLQQQCLHVRQLHQERHHQLQVTRLQDQLQQTGYKKIRWKDKR